MEDLSKYCCRNESCKDYGLKELGNLMVRDRYGIEHDRLILQCKTCRKKFASTQGTVFFHGHLATSKAIAVLAHVDEGIGVRKTSRLVHVTQETVINYSRRAGEHAKKFHDQQVAFSPSDDRDSDGREVEHGQKETGPLQSGKPRR